MKIRFTTLNIITAMTMIAFLFFLQIIVEDATEYWVNCKDKGHAFLIENGILSSTVYAKRNNEPNFTKQFTVYPWRRVRHQMFDEFVDAEDYQSAHYDTPYRIYRSMTR